MSQIETGTVAVSDPFDPDPVNDYHYAEHVAGKAWLRGHCTCRTLLGGGYVAVCASNLHGRRCSRPAQVCGGYCKVCFPWKQAQPSPLTFQTVTAVNVARATRWHPGFPDDDEWTVADWSNAMCGEAGEAANVVKKMRRYDCDLQGNGDPTRGELQDALAEELADVFLYLNLLAAKAGVDLELAVRRKFNKVSERQGFPERLQEPTPHPDDLGGEGTR